MSVDRSAVCIGNSSVFALCDWQRSMNHVRFGFHDQKVIGFRQHFPFPWWITMKNCHKCPTQPRSSSGSTRHMVPWCFSHFCSSPFPTGLGMPRGIRGGSEVVFRKGETGGWHVLFSILFLRDNYCTRNDIKTCGLSPHASRCSASLAPLKSLPKQSNLQELAGRWIL